MEKFVTATLILRISKQNWNCVHLTESSYQNNITAEYLRIINNGDTRVINIIIHLVTSRVFVCVFDKIASIKLTSGSVSELCSDNKGLTLPRKHQKIL